jgi:hypothetical protein
MAILNKNLLAFQALWDARGTHVFFIWVAADQAVDCGIFSCTGKCSERRVCGAGTANINN